MKTFIAACAVGLAVAAPACLAETASRTGEVRGLYVRVAGGVMQEVRADRAPSGPLYADVALDAPLPNGRSFVIARVESDLRLRSGDPVLVQVDTASRREISARHSFAFIAQEPRVLGLAASQSSPFAESTPASMPAAAAADGRQAVSFLR